MTIEKCLFTNNLFVDFCPKIYLIFYPSLGNLTTHITIGNTNGVCSSCSCPVPNETTTVIPSIIKETNTNVSWVVDISKQCCLDSQK